MIVTTTVLVYPLEICPVEHLIDFGRSADRFGRMLDARDRHVENVRGNG